MKLFQPKSQYFVMMVVHHGDNKHVLWDTSADMLCIANWRCDDLRAKFPQHDFVVVTGAEADEIAAKITIDQTLSADEVLQVVKDQHLWCKVTPGSHFRLFA